MAVELVVAGGGWFGKRLENRGMVKLEIFGGIGDILTSFRMMFSIPVKN